MMGLQAGQEALFYKFSLERHVPADHLLRSINRFVDLGILFDLANFPKPSNKFGMSLSRFTDRQIPKTVHSWISACRTVSN